MVFIDTMSVVEPTIDNFLQVMHNYQKEHNITTMSCVNSMFLRDSVKRGFPTARVVPVFCISGQRTLVHLVVKIHGEILEPSYDIASLHDKVYVETVNDMRKRNCSPADIDIRKFLEFTELAAQINLLKMPCNSADVQYYEALADYCNKAFAAASK